jgi:hypothetical protein
MKLVGLVPEFHVLISIQTSAVFILYPGRYIRIGGAFRICQHCWHSHLVWFISRVLNLRLRWFQLGWTHNFGLLGLGKIHYLWISLLGATSDLLGGYPLTLLTTSGVVPLAMSCLVKFIVCMMMLGFMNLIDSFLWNECWCIVGLISVMTLVA